MTRRRRRAGRKGIEVTDDKTPRPPSVLGSYIRAQRQLASLSLRQLATLSNVSNAYLSQVERGLHQPSLKVLRSIADALDISTEHLLAQSEVMSPRGAREGSGAAAATSRVEQAVLADHKLSDEEKHAMLALYSTFAQRH